MWPEKSWTPSPVRRGPFARLVRHFLARLVRGDDSASAEFEPGAGALLGLLATPGAFQCLLMIDKYSSFLNWLRGRLRQDVLVASMSDKYMFLAIAMAVTGIVTVLKWDRSLPDPQDYGNLAPLPIRPRTVLLANAAAIAIAAGVATLAVNAISMLLFPALVVSSVPGAGIGRTAFMATHALCVLLASLFGFGFVFAVLGAAAAVLPRAAFQAWASWLQGALLVALLALLASGFAAPALLRGLRAAPDSPVRLLPPLWYLGLYQSLQHRAPPELARLAPLAATAMAALAVVLPAAYGLSYRRRYAGVLEGAHRSARRGPSRWALAYLDRFAAGTGFARAGYLFAVRALLRNPAQRLCLAVSLGLGCLMAVQSAAPAFAAAPRPDALPPGTLLGAPLLLAYLLVLGLRIAFEFPAAAPANWIFRSVLDPLAHESAGVCRRVMAAFLVALVGLPCLASSWWWGGFRFAVLHTLYVAALCICLVEFRLFGYRRIPFTCYLPGFREDLPMMCFLQVLGFVAFTRLGAEMERWGWAQPWCFLLVPAAMAVAWYARRRQLQIAAEEGELEIGLSFDSRPSPDFELLKLSGE